VVPIADPFRPSGDLARALPLSQYSSDSDDGILQSDPYSCLGHSHSRQSFGLACRGSLSDPAKSFRPISVLDETIVLSYIAADSDSGIYWGAFSAQGGAQTPQGFRSGAVEVRLEIRQTLFPVQRPGRIDWSCFQSILTVEFLDRVFQLITVTVLIRDRSFWSFHPCMQQICCLLAVTGISSYFDCIPVQIHEI
jgi:hypothetical protein